MRLIDADALMEIAFQHEPVNKNSDIWSMWHYFYEAIRSAPTVPAVVLPIETQDMERLTRQCVSVERSQLLDCERVNIKEISDRFYNLIINGPTLNGVKKDILRSFLRQFYERLKWYEEAEAALRRVEG